MRYRTDLVPLARRHRTGTKLKGGKAQSITIHNTANPDATAQNHADYLKNADRPASWHFTVDDIEAILHIPLDERAWHTATSLGNATSIGIEVCEFRDAARQRAANDNAIELVAALLHGSVYTPGLAHLTTADIRTHQSWSGKLCPRLILPWWDEFINQVKEAYRKMQAPKYSLYYVEGLETSAQIDLYMKGTRGLDTVSRGSTYMTFAENSVDIDLIRKAAAAAGARSVSSKPWDYITTRQDQMVPLIKKAVEGGGLSAL